MDHNAQLQAQIQIVVNLTLVVMKAVNAPPARSRYAKICRNHVA